MDFGVRCKEIKCHTSKGDEVQYQVRLEATAEVRNCEYAFNVALHFNQINLLIIFIEMELLQLLFVSSLLERVKFKLFNSRQIHLLSYTKLDWFSSILECTQPLLFFFFKSGLSNCITKIGNFKCIGINLIIRGIKKVAMTNKGARSPIILRNIP